MNLEQAKKLVAPYSIGFFFNKNLKLYCVVLDNTIEYITPTDFDRYDVPEFKSVISKKLVEYVALNEGSKLVFH